MPLVIITGKAQPDDYSEVRRPVQNILATLRGKRRWEKASGPPPESWETLPHLPLLST
jgi:hypothetical protein